MARTYVDDLKLKDYLLQQLSTNSIRELIANESFVQKTGINTKYYLEKEMKNFKIDIKAIYDYSIVNNIISSTTTLEEFTKKRKISKVTKTSLEKAFVSKEVLTRKKILINKLLQNGFFANDEMDISEIESLAYLLPQEVKA